MNEFKFFLSYYEEIHFGSKLKKLFYTLLMMYIKI